MDVYNSLRDVLQCYEVSISLFDGVRLGCFDIMGEYAPFGLNLVGACGAQPASGAGS